MFRYFIFLIAISSFCNLKANNQTSIFASNDNIYGNNWNLVNYFDADYQSWNFSDKFSIKNRINDTEFYDYYKQNYINNRLVVSNSGKNYNLSVFLNSDKSFSENEYNHILGYSDIVKFKNNLATGGEVNLNLGNFTFLGDIAYQALTFENENTNSQKDFNLKTYSHLSYAINKVISPFIEVFHYNDLSNIDFYNYTYGALGTRIYLKPFNNLILDQYISLGKNDLYSNFPYYTEVSSRITYKLTQRYMMLSKIKLKNFYSDDLSSIAMGSSFLEMRFQKIFGFSMKNYLDKAQLILKYSPDNEELTVGSEINCYIKDFILNIAAEKYVGENKNSKYSASGGIGYFITGNFYISYKTFYKKYKDHIANFYNEDFSLSHLITLNYNYR